MLDASFVMVFKKSGVRLAGYDGQCRVFTLSFAGETGPPLCALGVARWRSPPSSRQKSPRLWCRGRGGNARIGAQLFDEGRKLGHHLLPALPFGSRHPGVAESARIHADERKEASHRLQSAPRVKVSHTVVAILGMAAGNQDPVRALDERFDNEHGIHSPRAGNADDTKKRRLAEPAHPGGVRPAVRAPIAQEGENSKGGPIRHLSPHDLASVGEGPKRR